MKQSIKHVIEKILEPVYVDNKLSIRFGAKTGHESLDLKNENKYIDEVIEILNNVK